MLTIKLNDAGMAPKATLGAFTLYKSLVWTGCILLGEPGQSFQNSEAGGCPSLYLGSVAIIMDVESGLVLTSSVDHGELSFPGPKSGQRLILVTAEPLQFSPRALETIANAMIGGDDVLRLPEVESANARHFIAKLARAGIGSPPNSVL